ncbi:MAG: D-glycero-alpha-D-manno-heptose 1-phosphate guanylyltransferase [Candidatus Anoxychlamydiales bacterium]|nr:D-glycero-alpha-D-manno-heptose 1-phosphate guanylyltransferase [Candidatus Anoxychlamydiales bacterium]
MDVIILVGGKGTRLKRVIGDNLPKPLANINGTPFLDFLVHKLQKLTIINNIILAAGHKKEKIIDRYKDYKNILFSIEEDPLGTGGAIKKALNLAKSNQILALNGDTYSEFSPSLLLKAHQEKKADITIVCRFEKLLSRYGSVNIDKKTKQILSFNEKIKKNNGYINSGIYLMNKDTFDDFNPINYFSIEHDFFPKATLTKKIFAFETNSTFVDIGTPESYSKAQFLNF